jgi:hypothetical protein
LQFVDQFSRDAREVVDEIQRVLDLVCDPGGQLTERGKLLCLHKAVLCGPQILQRFCQLAGALLFSLEQPHVLDGDRRSIREPGDQFDLLVSECLHFRARLQHWDAQNCTVVAQSPRFEQSIFRISGCVIM